MTTPPLYINGKFLAQRMTGVQRVARCLVQALDEDLPDGLNPCVLLCPPGCMLPPLTHIQAITVGRPGRSLHFWEQWTLPRAAADGTLLSLAGSAPLFGRRQVCMIHDAAIFDQPGTYTPAFKAWYRLLFKRHALFAEALLTVSAFSRDRLADCLKVAPARIAVIVPGADHLQAVVPDRSILRRLRLEGSPYVLAVGSRNTSKNLLALAEAHARFARSRPSRLVVVGGQNEQVFAGASAPCAEPGWVLTGSVSDAELKALYEAALVLVFPSTYEGFGLPPLEAMCCDCPVIAARAAAVPEACGDAAFYVDPASVDEIAAALAHVANDPTLRDALRMAGRARIQRLPWADAAQRLIGVLLALRRRAA